MRDVDQVILGVTMIQGPYYMTFHVSLNTEKNLRGDGLVMTTLSTIDRTSAFV